MRRVFLEAKQLIEKHEPLTAAEFRSTLDYRAREIEFERQTKARETLKRQKGLLKELERRNGETYKVRIGYGGRRKFQFTQRLQYTVERRVSSPIRGLTMMT